MNAEQKGTHVRGEWRRQIDPRQMILIAAAIVIVWLASGVIMFLALDSWDDRGTAGDMFGAVNSLFSGLAFAAVVIALIVQRQDMNAQLEELKRSRESQVRPFVLASIEDFVMLERPKVTAADGGAAGSSMPVHLKLVNASQDPAINIEIRASVTGAGMPEQTQLDVIPLPLMPAAQTPHTIEFFLAHTGVVQCADGLLAGKPAYESGEGKPAPLTLWITIAFQNTLAATFQVTQAFGLSVEEDQDELNKWIADWNEEELEPEDVELAQSLRLEPFTLPGSFSYRMLTATEQPFFG